jgi:hypothetical protein
MPSPAHDPIRERLWKLLEEAYKAVDSLNVLLREYDECQAAKVKKVA